MQLELTTYIDLQATVKPRRYLEFLKASQENALAAIKARLRAGRKIRLGILCSGTPVWTGNDLVKLFLADSRFQAEVILILQRFNYKDEDNGLVMLESYFKDSGLPYRKATGSITAADYDILIYTIPYWSMLPDFSSTDVPLTTFLCYIPYGFWHGICYDQAFNLDFHNSLWKNFQFTSEYQELAAKHCEIGSHAMIYTGYPKLDPLFNGKLGKSTAWKIARGQTVENVKRIIWAPHHSLYTGGNAHSTFAENYEFMLLFAASHPEYSFIYRPHPLVGLRAVSTGLFATLEDYGVYCQAWDNLPNACYAYGPYMADFVTSHALITDCDSFLTEFLYVDKPCLYLMREGVEFNTWGKMCLENYYQVAGDDFPGIMDFLAKTIDQDPKRPAREQFYKEHLDYYTETGRTAAENVYHAIATEFDDIRPC